ncbi:MAG TPA: cell division protein CrgA [Frankiaceae bacterium]|nr:cell division protein CrgA [Frankiaceae bacterium]
MPVSRRRRKKSAPVVASPAAQAKRAAPPPSPPWYGGLILAMFILGVAWLLAYYLSNGGLPGVQAPIGGWNLLVGFGFVVVGLGLATRWR